MTVFKNVQIPNGSAFESLKKSQYVKGSDVIVDDGKSDEIDASHLTLFPALIDPHVHFRTPGQEYKEDWHTASRATIRGGYSTVFDMPNNLPACVTKERLHAKKELINQQLEEAGMPIHYELYFGADKNNFDQIEKVKDEVIGMKIFMGSSTGELLMDDDSSLHAAFSIAAHHNVLVGLHAEDECMIRERTKMFEGETSHHIHSHIRTPEVAAAAIQQVIDLVRMYGTRAYVLHVSSIQELKLLRQAKQEGLPIYAETSPHHLFLNTTYYEELHGRAQMNPPLRDPEHQVALFEAIHEGVIDTMGTDHAPHLPSEKDQPYPQSPSGVPGIETNLPLLLNAFNEDKLSLNEIGKMMRTNIEEMFGYKAHDDVLLVDLNKEKEVLESELKTKCAWSPYAGMKLKGWPVFNIINNTVFDLENF